MSKKRQTEPTRITADRLTRLYKLVALIASGTRSRERLLKKLKVDLRVFYRDIETLRSLQISIENDNENYKLTMAYEDALGQLPFPDPELSVREARTLSEGRSDAHRRLQEKVSAFLSSSAPFGPNERLIP